MRSKLDLVESSMGRVACLVSDYHTILKYCVIVRYQKSNSTHWCLHPNCRNMVFKYHVSTIRQLTHSLVDLPRWGLATADDHSDIFLLHCARSCDISFSWMYLQPVHSSMLCIHCLLGLPWCRSPSMIPSRTVSANCPALPRVILPKYCSFSFATLPINSLSRPNSVNIESFVRCSCWL